MQSAGAWLKQNTLRAARLYRRRVASSNMRRKSRMLTGSDQMERLLLSFLWLIISVPTICLISSILKAHLVCGKMLKYDDITQIEIYDYNTSNNTRLNEWANRQASSEIGPQFPYAVVLLLSIWIILIVSYGVTKWRNRGGPKYIIPRVFVLCSPRTVQFHYELILRVGLASFDFNPDKHDIDIIVLGQHRNEIVPLTRLNTRTLIEEPLVTSLSLIVYRLVEMPVLSGLILRHSGPYRAWVYAYDFTIIDLTTNKEQFFPLNQYIGSLNRVLDLIEPEPQTSVFYPVDDVPPPEWMAEDTYLLLFSVVSYIALLVTIMPINCIYYYDVICVILASIAAGTMAFFLDWLIYYYIRWNQERREYFNDYNKIILGPTKLRSIIFIVSLSIGLLAVYLCSKIRDYRDALVWSLVVLNTTIVVLGLYNIARQIDVGEALVSLGLKLRGIESTQIGMRYSDMINELRSRSMSTSDEGNSLAALASRSGSFATRSSVKSFGFDPTHVQTCSTLDMNVAGFSRLGHSMETGATRDNLPISGIMRGQFRPAVAARRRIGSKLRGKGPAASSILSEKLQKLDKQQPGKSRVDKQHQDKPHPDKQHPDKQHVPQNKQQQKQQADDHAHPHSPSHTFHQPNSTYQTTTTTTALPAALLLAASSQVPPAPQVQPASAANQTQPTHSPYTFSHSPHPAQPTAAKDSPTQKTMPKSHKLNSTGALRKQTHVGLKRAAATAVAEKTTAGGTGTAAVEKTQPTS